MLLNLVSLAIPSIAEIQKPSEPEAALRRSFERKLSANVDALVEKPFRGGDTIMIRMQYDGSGRRRTEIVSPLVVQGRVFIDDGATWTTYAPDRKLLRTHPAPPEENLDAKMRLVRKNYQLEIDQRTNIAGRPAIRVVATPRSHDLRTQRFYLDASTYTPLKAETVDGIGGVSVQFTVRRISFPARFDKDLFSPPRVAGAHREPGHAPIPFRADDATFRQVGFKPALPGRLPLGFRTIGMDVIDRGGRMPVAIRLTDGLVRLYVFQSLIDNGAPARSNREGDAAKACQDVGNIRIEVRGDDVPITARERILATYVWAYQKNAHP